MGKSIAVLLLSLLLSAQVFAYDPVWDMITADTLTNNILPAVDQINESTMDMLDSLHRIEFFFEASNVILGEIYILVERLVNSYAIGWTDYLNDLVFYVEWIRDNTNEMLVRLTALEAAVVGGFQSVVEALGVLDIIGELLGLISSRLNLIHSLLVAALSGDWTDPPPDLIDVPNVGEMVSPIESQIQFGESAKADVIQGFGSSTNTVRDYYSSKMDLSPSSNISITYRGLPGGNVTVTYHIAPYANIVRSALSVAIVLLTLLGLIKTFLWVFEA
jgi:hypothetical protein